MKKVAYRCKLIDKVDGFDVVKFIKNARFN